MKRILAFAALVLSLSSCIVVVPENNPPARPVVVNTAPTRPSVANIIQDFQPTRGNGAVYRVGESITLRMTLARAGFVTLVFYNDGALPDYEIRNIAVQAGVNLMPNNNTLVAAEPVGITRVRAFYTPQPNSTISFLNGRGVSFLEDTTNTWLNAYPPELRDVKDAFIRVSR
ncbi:MAG: hypothetical protein ACK41E_07260 [Deinococcales bacterium]